MKRISAKFWLIKPLSAWAIISLTLVSNTWADPALTPEPNLSAQQPQPQQAIDLLQAFVLARENDAQFKQQQQNLNAQQKSLETALTALRPQVSVSGDITHSQNDIDATSTSASRHLKGTSRIYSLNMAQSLYDLSTINNHQQSQVALTSVEKQRLIAIQSLMERVTTLYFDSLLAAKDKALAAEQQQTLKQLLARAQQRFKAGLTTITDVLEAQAQFDNAKVEVLQTKNNEAISLENLKLLIGYLPLELHKLSDQPTDASIQSLDFWQTAAQNNSLELQLAQDQLEQAQLENKLANKAYTPSLSLFGRVANTQGYQSGFDQPDQTTSSIGLSVEVPLYLGGAIDLKKRETSYKLLAQKDALKLSQLTLERDIINLHHSAVTAFERIKAQKSSLDSSLKALEATQSGYRSGTRTFLDVLLAQQSVFNAQRNEANSRIIAIKSLLALNQRAGTLSEQTLETFNQWLSK